VGTLDRNQNRGQGQKGAWHREASQLISCQLYRTKANKKATKCSKYRQKADRIEKFASTWEKGAGKLWGIGGV